MESRIRKAVDELERRLARLPETTARVAPAAEGDVDEVTASFRRALSEAIDRKLEEVLAPAVSLYQRLLEEARELREEAPRLRPSDLEPIVTDALGDLEKILRLLGGDFIQPKPGEHYDPLIHQAIGEAGPSGGGEGVVADVVRTGYRSGRGKVVATAKVLLGRR